MLQQFDRDPKKTKFDRFSIVMFVASGVLWISVLLTLLWLFG